MKLFPYPWEGAHPLLPERQEPSIAQGPLASTLFGLGTYGLARLFRRAKTPGTAMLMIGANSIIFYGLKNPLISDYTEKARAAYAVFEKENLPKPSRQLFKSSSHTTVDDFGIAGAVAGLVRAASTTHFQNSVLRRLLRSLGCGSAGFAAGAMAFTIYFELHDDGESSANATRRDLIAQTRAADGYRTLMGEDPPYALYPLAADNALGQGFTYKGGDASKLVETRKRWGSSIGFGQSPGSDRELPIDWEKLEADAAAFAGQIEVEEEPLPEGTFAFKMVKVNDEITTEPKRDYEWKPESTEQAINALRDFIDEQSTRRAALVQSAEYLYRQLAKWEQRLNLAIQSSSRSEADEREINLLGRSAEFLSVLHSRDYRRITSIDWLIADAKKQILQLQSKGHWMPAGEPASYDPKTYDAQKVRDELEDFQRKQQDGFKLFEEAIKAIEKDGMEDHFKALHPGLWERMQLGREVMIEEGMAVEQVVNDLD